VTLGTASSTADQGEGRPDDAEARPRAASPAVRPLFWLASRPLDLLILAALLVLAATLPLVLIRSYHYEEGLTVGLAKSVLAGDPWYAPLLYGQPFIERPVLQSWIVAALSWPLGVGQVAARLPTIVAVAAGAMMIAALIRPHASRAAALFGALCMLFCPLTLQKLFVAESDLLVASTQFAAFFLWWRGHTAGKLALWRWVAIGLLLAATALFKGPQPAAFFAVGVGAFILVHKEWRQIPGFCLAGVISLGLLGLWYAAILSSGQETLLLRYMRLQNVGMSVAEYLARLADYLGSLLVEPLPISAIIIVLVYRRWRGMPSLFPEGSRPLVRALLFYGGLALLVLTFWPGAITRYAFPALPAFACIAGLAFDGMLKHMPRLAAAASVLVTGLVGYQLVLAWVVAPIFWESFAARRLDAAIIDTAATVRDRPILAPVRSNDGLFAYLERPARYLSQPELATIETPAYLLAPKDVCAAIQASRPDLKLAELAMTGDGGMRLCEFTR
jgi:4-amino-4-deoxy-L-arabinose transferase-like glycosyltransferase